MAKILIVNHDEDTMELLKTWLERRGLEARYVKEDEAISTLKEFKADVVLIDVLQIDAVKKIKDEIELSNIPVVLMTGHTIIPTDYTNIADEVVQKPFQPAEMEKKIQKVLAKTG